MKYLIMSVMILGRSPFLFSNFGSPDAFWICDEQGCGTLNEEEGPCEGCGKAPGEDNNS